MIIWIILVITMFVRIRRRQSADWNRRRWRNYEWDRAVQSFFGMLVFLFVALVLAAAFAGWNR